MDQKDQQMDPDRDDQKSGRPVQLDKDKPDQQQGGGQPQQPQQPQHQQGGQPHPGRPMSEEPKK